MKKATKKKTTAQKRASKASPKKPAKKPSFSAKINELKDWRGDLLREIRFVVKSAVPGVVEELKWRDVPVWSKEGILTTGEVYKAVVKMTFHKGAALKDPAKLFNSSLEGNARRAIDFKEGDRINAKALKALLQEAVKLNQKK